MNAKPLAAAPVAPQKSTSTPSKPAVCGSTAAKKPAKKLSLDVSDVQEVLERKISPAAH